MALLAKIEADNPAEDISIIIENLSSHNSKPNRMWLEDHPRLHQLFIPKGYVGLTCRKAGGVSSEAMR
jgi:hypothetical protein